MPDEPLPDLPPDRPGLPVPGEMIGPYRVVRLLGQGGMGAVYDALDTTLDRHVALKVIRPALALDPDMRERFGREARAQAALDSPHVVPVLAHGEADGRLYLACRLVPDGDLGSFLHRHGPLTPALAADLVAQVADGLAAAHRAGLVHRDVKASNVMLHHRGTDTVAYLADFGIAEPLVGDEAAHDLAALDRLHDTLVGGRVTTDPSRRRPRRRARGAVALALGGLAVAIAVAVAIGVVRTVPPGRDPEIARREVGGPVQELREQTGLGEAVAACTVRRLPVPARRDVLGRPERRDDVLAAAAACLWGHQPSAGRVTAR